ncbi:yrdC domain-containing protein, mitochondrial isoform X2 [Pseudorasbora parva]|uniref:yrdC domain-containing protein, mitochondrial isoform X2 n=1 Tax=Pseudorasbora parva TaxID=51549 RepID=UPI00351DE81C
MLFFGFIRTVRIILKPSSYTPNSRLERVGKLGMCKEVKTRVLRICPQNHELTSQQQREWMEVLSSTTEALKAGLVVALPTDTIYGLACAAQNSAAVQRVYDIKGRSGDKPLAICVGEIQDIYRYCKVCVKEELLSDLLPGPVTLVLERSAALNADLNPFTKEFEDLWPSLAVVVDGGPIGDQSRLGSTVVDLSVCGRYRIIRPGCALSATVKVLEGKYGLLEDPVYQ